MIDWITQRPVPLDFNGPVDVPYDPIAPHWLDRSPIARFDRMVELYGDRLAIDDGITQLTYRQVQRAARALAHILVERTPPGRPIAGVFRYTALVPAALLASIAAGRPLVPVDAAYPLPRQQMILDNAGAATVLVQAGVALEAALPDVPVISVALDALLAGVAEDWPAIPYDPDALAGVTFTSGSTGNPKGLVWSVGEFLASRAALTDTHHLNADDKIIALGSLASAGLGDAMFALLNGASLRTIEVMSAGIGELLRVMGEERVTILSFVPAILRSVLAMEGAEHAFRHLRLLDLYGDATLVADVDFFRTKLPVDCHIRLVLGSIEAGEIFHWFVPRDFVTDDLALPCGYLSAGKHIALLDADGASVAPGGEGDLVARGRALALGTWQDGRVTQGPFLPDPDDAHARIYPMGDRVRLREDGLCVFAGRRDRMVKVRGLRTDLGEIEAAVRQHPGVADVAVVAVPDQGDMLVIAYCTARDPAVVPTRSELRRVIGGTTAEHMVPRRFVFVDAIPRLPNYKPDLIRLAATAQETSLSETSQ